MTERTIELPPLVQAEIRRQAADVQPSSPLTEDAKAEFLASVPVEFQVEAEAHFDRLADQDEGKRWEFLEGSILTITRMLREAELGRFAKPLLTMEEASAMLSMSHKRFQNIIHEEKARTGRTPDFVINADGRIQARVLRDELIAWAKGRGKRHGRPHVPIARAS